MEKSDIDLSVVYDYDLDLLINCSCGLLNIVFESRLWPKSKFLGIHGACVAQDSLLFISRGDMPGG